MQVGDVQREPLGAAGVGKSRLVAELVARVGPQATVLAGRCLDYGDGITFWPVAEILRQAARIGADDPPATGPSEGAGGRPGPSRPGRSGARERRS